MPGPSLAAGLGLKPEHYAQALACRAGGLWFEVHAENYMAQGGPRLAWLEAIAGQHPISLHGVGLSLGAPARPERDHLTRLAALARRFEPALVSEHLAWSAWRGVSLPDLLPVPRTAAALAQVAANVQETQEALGRRIAVENPSHYVAMPWHEMDEPAFLAELVRRTGCAILLDVNNVHVGARNLGLDPRAMLDGFLDALPEDCIAEIHVAGHSEDPALGARLLVDSHDAPVADPVWALLEAALARLGPRPVLLERDGNLPRFDELMAERGRAQVLFEAASRWQAAA